MRSLIVDEAEVTDSVLFGWHHRRAAADGRCPLCGVPAPCPYALAFDAYFAGLTTLRELRARLFALWRAERTP